MDQEIENVVFISIDSLREDYFVQKENDLTIPALTELADSGIYFDSVITPAPFTIPSHATMFSGLQPFNHGIRDQKGTFAELTSDHSIFNQLSKEGFNVASLDSTPILENRSFGWNLKGNANPSQIKKQIGAIECPFFLFIHFWDVHTPYYTRIPIEKMMDGFANLFQWSDPDTPRSRFRQIAYNKLRKYRIERIRDMVEEDNKKILERVKRGYMDAIEYVDQKIQMIFESLRRNNKRERTIVIITSDHGESFNEHNEIHSQIARRYEHGHFLYENLIRIPAVFAHESFPSYRISSQVSTVDYAPTIFRLLGINPDLSFDGEPLIPFIFDDGDYQSHVAYSEVVRDDQPEPERMRAVRDGTYKLIVDNERGECRLYDVENDPKETKDLHGEGLHIEKSLQRELENYLNRDEEISNRFEMSDRELKEVEDHLSELGYG